MRAWYKAAAGRLDPFILVLEGSVPNEEINGDGHWAGFGVDPETEQPILTNTWIDRLAPKAAAVLALGHLRRIRRDPRDAQQPDGRDGPARLPGLGLGVPCRACRSSTCPGCPVQPDNITETLLSPGAASGRHGPDARSRRAGAAAADLRAHRPRDLRSRRAGRAGPVLRHPRRRSLPGQAWLQGPVVKCNVPFAAGPTASAAAPTWAASAWPARCPASPTSTCRSSSPTPRRGCMRGPPDSPTARW